MRSRFENLSKPELDFLIDNCNFSEDEIIIITMANTGYSEIQTAERLHISVSSVNKKKRQIMLKINNLMEVIDQVTTIYIKGERVTKEEMKNYEIQIESVKKILSDKLKKNK